MGLDQYAHLRNRKIDWKNTILMMRKKAKKNRKMSLFGESTQDFKHL